MLQVAIERNDHRHELIADDGYRLDTVTSWAGEFTDRHHRWLFTEHKFRIHFEDATPDKWLPVEHSLRPDSRTNSGDFRGLTAST